MKGIPTVHCSRWLGALLCLVCACGPDGSAKRPNIIWIVWDTVRADHMSVYGYSKPTTPNVDVWAKDARVFEDCISPGTTTVPSHASMFTGLAAKQHGASNDHQHLDANLDTIAELLQAAGYQTYLWAANPHISTDENYTQGFSVEQHPWDLDEIEEARQIIEAKFPPDYEGEVKARLRGIGAQRWPVKAAGALARKNTLNWLTHRADPSQPFFVFLNYMEAHRPLFPSRTARQRMMSPAQIEASYKLDFSWDATWEYNFRLRDYTQEELEVLVATYDAAIVELDDLFAELLTSLREAGQLDNTIVILTSDHGEHLGEQHLLDHQYSAYQPLLCVPLIVQFPPKLAPGRETRPVMTHDLFSTLLELTHTPAPRGVPVQSMSLLAPRERRVRVSEYPVAFARGLETAREAHPEFDPSPWNRGLSAIIDGKSKLIYGSDGRSELFDLGADPKELSDLSTRQADLGGRLERGLDNYLGGLERVGSGERPTGTKSIQDILGETGYGGDDKPATHKNEKPKAPERERKDAPTPPGDH